MLAPGEAWKGQVLLDWHLDREHVNNSKAEVALLQGSDVPEIYDAPRPGWSTNA